MPEKIDHFNNAAQNFSEARQIAEKAIAEKRGMTAEETLQHQQFFNAACNERDEMKRLEAQEQASRIATIEGEIADMINGGEGGLSERSRRATHMYEEMYNAQSVPYRWARQGPVSLRRSGIEIESAIPNPIAEQDWSFLERRSTKDYQQSMENYLASPGNKRAASDPTHQIDLDQLGGFWAMPVQMLNDILRVADNMVYVRQKARVVPRVNAQALAGRFLEEDVEDSDWTGEVTDVDITKITAGLRRLRPKNLNKAVQTSFDMMMQEPSISAYLIERLGYKRGITEEKGYFTGNGVNEALGAMTASPMGIDTDRDVDDGNTQTEVTLEGIQGAKWSIRAAYWNDLTWFGARDFWLQVSLLRGTNGQPIWHTAVDMRSPDTLLGDPAYISEYMPSVFTAGQYVGIVGNWYEGYMIADAYDSTLQIIDQQFGTHGIIVYVMRSKTDGMPIRPDAFARLKLAN